MTQVAEVQDYTKTYPPIAGIPVRTSIPQVNYEATIIRSSETQDINITKISTLLSVLDVAEHPPVIEISPGKMKVTFNVKGKRGVLNIDFENLPAGMSSLNMFHTITDIVKKKNQSGMYDLLFAKLFEFFNQTLPHPLTLSTSTYFSNLPLDRSLNPSRTELRIQLEDKSSWAESHWRIINSIKSSCLRSIDSLSHWLEDKNIDDSVVSVDDNNEKKQKRIILMQGINGAGKTHTIKGLLRANGASPDEIQKLLNGVISPDNIKRMLISYYKQYYQIDVLPVNVHEESVVIANMLLNEVKNKIEKDPNFSCIIDKRHTDLRSVNATLGRIGKKIEDVRMMPVQIDFIKAALRNLVRDPKQGEPRSDLYSLVEAYAELDVYPDIIHGDKVTEAWDTLSMIVVTQEMIDDLEEKTKKRLSALFSEDLNSIIGKSISELYNKEI